MNDRFFDINFFEKISEQKKFAHKKEWFKKRIDSYIAMARLFYSGGLFGTQSYYDRYRALALLANGQLDKEDIQRVLMPVKDISEDLKVIDELPDDFTHKDIITPKIDIILSLENKKPWLYRAIAYNKEAINSKLHKKRLLMQKQFEKYLLEMEAKALEKVAEEIRPKPQQPSIDQYVAGEGEELNSKSLLDLFQRQAQSQGANVVPLQEQVQQEPSQQPPIEQIQSPDIAAMQQAAMSNPPESGAIPPERLARMSKEEAMSYLLRELGQGAQQQVEQAPIPQAPPEVAQSIPPEAQTPMPPQASPQMPPQVASAPPQGGIPPQMGGLGSLLAQALGGGQQQIQGAAAERIAAKLEEQANRLREIAATYMTDEEIERYISREYKDQSEIFANHILNYAKDRLRLKNKFINGLKHAIVFGREIYYVDIINDNVVVENVNPLYFDCDSRPHLENIEDGEWAVRLLFLSPTEIMTRWGDEISKEDMEKLSILPFAGDFIFRDDLSIDDAVNSYSIHIPVFHVVWKAMRQVRILKYKDEDGNEKQTIVDHDYVPGDDEEWEDLWIPEVYEGYRIFSEVYVGMGYCKTSTTNIDNPLDKKLPYIGTIYHGSSIVERCKVYQYLYDVLMYKLERLLAQDMNKKVFINMNLIPRSENMDIGKFLTMLHRLNIGFVDPQNTAQGLNDVAAAIKEVDMSPTFDLRHILEIMNTLNAQISQLFGVISTKEGVLAIKQEEIDSKREELKIRVMDHIIEAFRKVIALSDLEYIEYMSDDLDAVYAKIHSDEFVANRYHVYIDIDRRIEEINQFLMQNAAEMLRAGLITASDFTRIARAKTLQEAEEILRKAEQKREQMMQSQQQAQMQLEQMKFQQQVELENLRHQHELQRLIVNNRERRETIRIKTILQNYLQLPSEDINKNKVPDQLEIYNATRDMNMKERKIQLEEEKIRTKQQEIQSKERIEREWMRIQKEGIENSKQDNDKGKRNS
ncbi:MAG: hypothetical protein KatS3mg083_518 [Candidatus Dojkabacteria bacterium]|nr:MAG: hypothetical protein KatS3mg083_518 [Candidatus Dojkabacteria bacterium]